MNHLAQKTTTLPSIILDMRIRVTSREPRYTWTNSVNATKLGSRAANTTQGQGFMNQQQSICPLTVRWVKNPKLRSRCRGTPCKRYMFWALLEQTRNFRMEETMLMIGENGKSWGTVTTTEFMAIQRQAIASPTLLNPYSWFQPVANLLSDAIKHPFSIVPDRCEWAMKSRWPTIGTIVGAGIQMYPGITFKRPSHQDTHTTELLVKVLVSAWHVKDPSPATFSERAMSINISWTHGAMLNQSTEITQTKRSKGTLKTLLLTICAFFNLARSGDCLDTESILPPRNK